MKTNLNITQYLKKGIALFTFLFIFSCSDDGDMNENNNDNTAVIFDTEVSWEVLSVDSNTLKVELTLDDEDNTLPEGTMVFSIDGEELQSLPIEAGTQELVPYTFTDNEEHTASVELTLTEGDESIMEEKTIQRVETVATTSSDESDWVDSTN